MAKLANSGKSSFTDSRGVVRDVPNDKPASFKQLELAARISVGIVPEVKATAEQWAAFRRTRGALYAYSQENLVSHGFIQGIVGGKKLPKKITDLIQEAPAKPASKKAKPSKASKASKAPATVDSAMEVKALIALLKEQGFEVVKAQENA